jgi:hypothetical protein
VIIVDAEDADEEDDAIVDGVVGVVGEAVRIGRVMLANGNALALRGAGASSGESKGDEGCSSVDGFRTGSGQSKSSFCFAGDGCSSVEPLRFVRPGRIGISTVLVVDIMLVYESVRLSDSVSNSICEISDSGRDMGAAEGWSRVEPLRFVNVG